MSFNENSCVTNSFTFKVPPKYWSTSFGTLSRLFHPAIKNCQVTNYDARNNSSTAPPKAEPFQVRPVTNWNGRVLISWPEPATPIIVETPQPLWQLSKAARWNSLYCNYQRDLYRQRRINTVYHSSNVADTFKCIIQSPVSFFNQNFLNRFFEILWIDTFCCAERFCYK